MAARSGHLTVSRSLLRVSGPATMGRRFLTRITGSSSRTIRFCGTRSVAWLDKYIGRGPTSSSVPLAGTQPVLARHADADRGSLSVPRGRNTSAGKSARPFARTSSASAEGWSAPGHTAPAGSFARRTTERRSQSRLRPGMRGPAFDAPSPGRTGQRRRTRRSPRRDSRSGTGIASAYCPARIQSHT